MLCVAPLMLTACSVSTGSTEAPILAKPPVSFTIPCERPVRLPSGQLTQSQVEALWLKDRSNLISCGATLEALKEFYVKRDKGVTNI